ncbi:MAG: putative transporter, permease protein [bacterium]|nr:putative transporter, permease protein [bacterium]
MTAGALLARVGDRAASALDSVGTLAMLAARAVSYAVRPPLRWRAVLYQIHVQGNRALALAVAAAIFVGMALAVQFGFGLSRFGATSLLSQLTTLGLVRELLPVFSGLVIGARIGAGIAAELGSMAVTEQLDAMRVMGADPVRELVTPRVVAAIIVLPFITVLGDVIATVGAMVVGKLQYGIGGHYFLDSLRGFLTIGDFVTGVIKSAVFGLLVALFACRQGLIAQKGTQGVGVAATRAVVDGTLAVIVANYFLSVLALRLLSPLP